MYLQDKETGRWAFIFSISNPVPFNLNVIGGSHFDFEVDWSTLQLAEVITKEYEPIEAWLKERTSAYRINTVSLKTCVSFKTQAEDYIIKWIIPAIIEVPDSLAVLFKMFWY